jgi:hypothetical protein
MPFTSMIPLSVCSNYEASVHSSGFLGQSISIFSARSVDAIAINQLHSGNHIILNQRFSYVTNVAIVIIATSGSNPESLMITGST